MKDFRVFVIKRYLTVTNQIAAFVTTVIYCSICFETEHHYWKYTCILLTSPCLSLVTLLIVTYSNYVDSRLEATAGIKFNMPEYSG